MGVMRKTEMQRHHQGSLEQRLAQVRSAVQEAYGADATVLATQDTYVVVRQGDGTIQEVPYQLQEGRMAALVGGPVREVPCLEGHALHRVVAADLHQVVEAMLANQPLDRVRVRDLAMGATKEVAYWLGEAITALTQGAETAPWWTYFSPRSAQIRESLHGSIRQLEAEIPRTRFAKLPPTRLAAYAEEMHSSIAQLQRVAQGLFDVIQEDVSYHEEGVNAVHQSLRQDAKALTDGLTWILTMDWHGQFEEIATAHDRIAARLRDGMIMHAHLRALTRE